MWQDKMSLEKTGSVFYRTAAEIKEIVEVCKENE